MGFLLAGFGKQMAGTRMRAIQANIMRISRQVARIQKDYRHMKKDLENAQKAEINALKFQNQQAIALASKQLLGTMQSTMAGLGKDQNISQSNEYKMAEMFFSQTQSQKQAELTYMTQQIESKYEYLQNEYLEPLKEEEEELTSEKDLLESQFKMAEEDYKACKQMEQNDAKYLAPNYTGGQG